MNMAFQMKLSDEVFDELVGNEPVDETYNEKFEHSREVVNLLLKNSMNKAYVLNGTAVQAFAYSQKSMTSFYHIHIKISTK